jgi:2'-5' RNA ligase
VTGATTVEGRDRLRLFCALRLPDPVLHVLVDWQRSELPDGAVRPVPREQLHITLAFLGSRPAGDVAAVVDALRAAAEGARAGELQPSARPYRETRSVGMLVLEDVDGSASRLARDLHDRLARLELYRPEQRAWLPHVTVARFRRPPRLRPAPPEGLGRFSPSDAALYTSLLRPGGAQYEVIETVSLGGG